MTEQFKKLLEYQELDYNAEKIEKDLLNCEERKKANTVKQIFENANEGRKKLNNVLQTLKADLASIEKQCEELFSKASKLQEDMNNDYDSLEEIEQQNIRLKEISDTAQKLNSEIKAIASNAQSTEKKFDDMTERAASARDEFAVCKDAYEKKYNEIKPMIDEAKAKKIEAEKDVDPELLGKYKALRANRIVPTAKLVGSKCTGCNMELPSAIAKKVETSQKVIECENCARMLYV